MKLVNRKDEQGFYEAKVNKGTFNPMVDGWYIRFHQYLETVKTFKEDDGATKSYETDTMPRYFGAIKTTVIIMFIICCVSLGFFFYFDVLFGTIAMQGLRNVVAILALIGLPVSAVLLLLVYGLQALIKNNAQRKRNRNNHY